MIFGTNDPSDLHLRQGNKEVHKFEIRFCKFAFLHRKTKLKSTFSKVQNDVAKTQGKQSQNQWFLDQMALRTSI